MSASPSPQDTPTFTFDRTQFWPYFALGWVLGAGLVFLVRWLGNWVLAGPCEGRTLLALAVPLLLGPGGLAFAALNWQRPRLGALGLGLMLASLLPGLYIGARDIGALRGQGCAGGYIVLALPNQKSVSEITVIQGQTVDLVGRIGGYTPQTHPEAFTLTTQTDNAALRLTLDKTQVKVGEPFTLHLSAGADTPLNTFKAGVQANSQQSGKQFAAVGVVDVQVKP